MRVNLFDLATAACIIPSAKFVPIEILAARGNPILKGTGTVLNASSWGSSESKSFFFSHCVSFLVVKITVSTGRKSYS